MATKETEAVNQTQEQEEKVPCSKCDGKTYHKVLLSIDQSGEERDGGFDFFWQNKCKINGINGVSAIFTWQYDMRLEKASNIHTLSIDTMNFLEIHSWLPQPSESSFRLHHGRKRQ